MEPTNPWRNSVEPLDVNNDTFISPLDALLVINELNTVGAHELQPPTEAVTAYLDTSDNGFVEPLDALLVLNHLNQSNVDNGEGENALAALPLPLPSQLDTMAAAEHESSRPMNPNSVDGVFSSLEDSRPLDLQLDAEDKVHRLPDSSAPTQTESLDIDPLETF